MSEAPRKKRFQVHLSTAVVLMIAAGGIVWANVRERRVETIGMAGSVDSRDYEYISDAEFLHSRHALWYGIRESEYGWPRPAMTWRGELRLKRSGEIDYGMEPAKFWYVPSIVVNVLIGLSILFAVWFMSEWWIRRRAARKGT